MNSIRIDPVFYPTMLHAVLQEGFFNEIIKTIIDNNLGVGDTL